ncbi:putative Ig domain-containing protein [Paralysiella testudinis]|uniref:Dystroglycan-type cadherin-like domain-containing protein n=1 Tax=Paralysiella testudinis TaxID=2809020 RepID=A0A892ZMF9_9NEIS|nr:putative Ig domain-containing protein [Paralysiella testudinis]QRQ82049.1 hypothetical protein JQU52_00960 [Paralysiella testudinis]
MFSDADGDVLHYTVVQSNGVPLPAWLSYDAASQTLSGTAGKDDIGKLSLMVVAQDPAGASAQQAFTLTVAADNAVYITGFGISGLGDDEIVGSAGDDIIWANAGNDTVYAGKGNDFVNGGLGDDHLFGEEGNDTLQGGLGDDVLSGGLGNDKLEGGLGNDTYLFAKGDGQDRIYDLGGSNDTLTLSDLTVNDVWFARQGNHLEISVIGSEDKITVENQFLWFFGHPNKVENIRLDNGIHIADTQLDKLINAMAAFAPGQNNGKSVPEQMQQYMHQIGAADYWQGNSGIL